MATKLSQKELACNAETLEHIMKVNQFLNMFIVELLKRGQSHDQTKLDHPEVELFAEETPKLAKLEYGTDEYQESLDALKPALEHHYAKNRHHPEHYPNGISGMTLIDLIEMVCDWKASSYRQHNGNILQSIEKVCEKHNAPPEMVQILKNTVEFFDLTH